MEVQSSELLPFGAMICGFFGSVFFLAGVFFTRHFQRALELGRISLNWPCAAGSILSSHVEVSQGSDSDDTIVLPRIVYRYHVAGKAYEGRLIAFGLKNLGLGEKVSNDLARLLQSGTKVDVFYNPLQPEQAVLYPGETDIVKNARLVGKIFIYVGTAMLAGAIWAALS